MGLMRPDDGKRKDFVVVVRVKMDERRLGI